MVTNIKIRKVDGALGAIFPKEILEELNVEEGDRLHVIRTEDGIILLPYDSEFAKTMESFEHIRKKYRNTLKELAK